jgi:hypothetical protein
VIREFAIARLESFLEEVKRLDESEFPYEHSRSALKLIQSQFQKRLDRLRTFHSKSDPGIVKQECALSLTDLFNYVPVLGFILRSTNVRNSFEVFGPLLRMAGDLLEPGTDKAKRRTRLVLSSEWDFSPFVYREIPHLPGFVLIGLPAPESSNPLLIPLAGHELGHSLWGTKNLGSKIRASVRAAIVSVIQSKWKEFQTVYSPGPGKTLSVSDVTTDMFCVQFWEQCMPWAMRQAEESFCDFVGLWLFGESYLNAFAYLLSPNSEGTRSLLYPNTKRRVSNLIDAANRFAYSIPGNYIDNFDDLAEPNLIRSDAFLLTVADEVVEKHLDTLISLADSSLSTAGMKRSNLFPFDSCRSNREYCSDL